MSNDTIYAPSTAIGGAIAVLRVSGFDTARAMQILSRDIRETPREMRYLRILDGMETVDRCMAVWFPSPASYTGEDMLEINCHGGPAIVRRILALLSKLGFRPAEGGEFTRRAFLNGKLDLTQAEAVMDVVSATAEQSGRAAMRQLAGSVSREVGAIAELLTDALAGVDAAIDYPDEAEADAYAALPEKIADAKSRMERLIDEGRRGRVLRDGLRVAILGRPNVGKSSLLNALLGEERAIVTASAGTTRDVLDAYTAFSGVPVRLVDTAGIRDAEDEAERIGVGRARDELAGADVRILLLDASVPPTDADRSLLRETEGLPRIIAANKCDLGRAPETAALEPLFLSAKTGEGLETLRARVLLLAAPEHAETVCLTNERHIHAMERALAALHEADPAAELDCVATDLGAALHALGEITGADVDETVIDRIFARFCVGK